nr:DUF2156 domain-containing protein [Geobacter sp. DSM 9736]
MSIPRYPDSRELDLGDKELFDPLLADFQPRISELTFANLYLFRKAHSYSVSRLGEAVIVRGRGYGGDEYVLPPLGADRRGGLKALLDEGVAVYGVDERMLAEELVYEGLEPVEDRDDFDYLYLRSDLAELPGNRFHKKKNRINYFLNRHECKIERYTASFAEGCGRLLQEWRRVRQEVESPSFIMEVEAAMEALQLAERLRLEGVVALVGGEVKGFALGEQLSRDTSVCHFEKADPFLEGLYQLVNREFCRLLFTHCTFVNREQDLGEQNLREAKLSYHPVELVKKYKVRKRR